jgi:hypothetical protein
LLAQRQGLGQKIIDLADFSNEPPPSVDMRFVAQRPDGPIVNYLSFRLSAPAR